MNDSILLTMTKQIGFNVDNGGDEVILCKTSKLSTFEAATRRNTFCKLDKYVLQFCKPPDFQPSQLRPRAFHPQWPPCIIFTIVNKTSETDVSSWCYKWTGGWIGLDWMDLQGEV